MSGGIIAGAAITAVAGYAASRKQRKDEKEALKQGRATSRAESIWAREENAFDKSLDNFYRQKERVERQRGLDEFRKFSTVQSFAPEYTNTNRIENPVMPNAQDAYDPNKKAPAPTIKPLATAMVNNMGGGGG